jgi:hypothetical protein
MQRRIRRQTVRWVVVSLLLLITLIILFSDHQDREEEFDSLLFDRAPDVTSIEIIRQTDSILLVRKDSLWFSSAGESLNRQAVDNLLAATGRMQLVSILNGSDVDMEGADRFLFRKNDREIYRIIVKPAATSTLVTREGYERVFAVELPGYSQATLQGIFSTDADHFREHLLVEYLPREIRRIEVVPFSGGAFRVLQDSAGEVLMERLPGEDVPVNASEHKLRMLLSYFNILRFERVMPVDSLPPGFNPVSPDADITVEGSDGAVHRFRVWKWVRKPGGTPDLFMALVRYNDAPRVLVVNYAYLDLLLRGAEAYLEQ